MLALVYCKTKNMKSYKAFDIGRGIPVDRLIYASMVEVSDEVKEYMQQIADKNTNIGLSIQLRVGDKVCFKTK